MAQQTKEIAAIQSDCKQFDSSTAMHKVDIEAYILLKGLREKKRKNKNIKHQKNKNICKTSHPGVRNGKG